jgi:hypothetical protein
MIREGASLRILKYKSNKLHAMPIILRDALQMAAILFFSPVWHRKSCFKIVKKNLLI